MNDVRSFAAQYASLWPCVLGLACARMGLAVAQPAGHAAAPDGMPVDAVLVAAAAIVALCMAVVFKMRCTFGKRFVNALIHVSAVVQAAGALALGVAAAAARVALPISFALAALVMAASLACGAYWLRRVRGSSMSTAVVTVFGALAISEAFIWLSSFLPQVAQCCVCAPFALAQIACVHGARKRANARSLETPTRSDDYFAFMRKGMANARFLAACAVGLCFLSVVGGFLCGFPDGRAVALTDGPRTVSFVVVEILCFALIAATLRQRSRVMTVGIWVVLELLAAFSLVVYSSSHGNAEYGAVFATALSAVMTGFVWYLIIVFMSYGWRDPFYYAMALWLFWTVSHLVGRFVPFLAGPVGPLAGDSHLMGTVISLLLLVSAQTVLVKLIDVAKFAYEEEQARLAKRMSACSCACADDEAVVPAALADEGVQQGGASAAKGGALEKLLGIDNDSAVSDVRDAALRHGAEEVGRRFLLSEREVEVLSLYMAGLTQKRVAEELHISQTTAHTHIGRIYTKTGMHSRQEILDYVRNHAD